MHTVIFSTGVRYMFKTTWFTRRAELPTPPVPGMHYEDGDWECEANEVTYSIPTGTYFVFGKTAEFQHNQETAYEAAIANYSDPESGWKRG